MRLLKTDWEMSYDPLTEFKTSESRSAMSKSSVSWTPFLMLIMLGGCLEQTDRLDQVSIAVSPCSIDLLHDTEATSSCLAPSLQHWEQMPVGSFAGCLLEQSNENFRALPIRLDEVDSIRTFTAPDYVPSSHGSVTVIFLDSHDPMACQSLTDTSACSDIDECYLGLGPMVIGQHNNFRDERGQCLYSTANAFLVPRTQLCGD